ncbi:MAG TPA: hypothetical protein ENF17_08200 [Candidatus Aminicenantes bacterium]|nr:hypothetical protein [Candidatus Aminicenantes bacterium]
MQNKAYNWSRKFLICALVLGLLVSGLNLSMWAGDSDSACEDALIRCLIDFRLAVDGSSFYCIIGYAFCLKCVKKS